MYIHSIKPFLFWNVLPRQLCILLNEYIHSDRDGYVLQFFRIIKEMAWGFQINTYETIPQNSTFFMAEGFTESAVSYEPTFHIRYQDVPIICGQPFYYIPASPDELEKTFLNATTLSQPLSPPPVSPPPPPVQAALEAGKQSTHTSKSGFQLWVILIVAGMSFPLSTVHTISLPFSHDRFCF